MSEGKYEASFEDKLEDFTKDMDKARTDAEKLKLTKCFLKQLFLGDDPSLKRCGAFRLLLTGIVAALIGGVGILELRTGFPILGALGVLYVYELFGPIRNAITQKHFDDAVEATTKANLVKEGLIDTEKEDVPEKKRFEKLRKRAKHYIFFSVVFVLVDAAVLATITCIVGLMLKWW